MKEFLLNRFKEPSTWYGAIMVAGSFGLELTEVQQNAIMFFGMAMMGAPDINLDKLKKK